VNKDTLNALGEQLGRATNKGCCGCDRAGIYEGAVIVLETLGINFDRMSLKEKINDVDDRLYDEQSRDIHNGAK
jgi:hypothetical protein